MTAPITVAAAEPLPDFQTLPDLIAAHAHARPESIALVCGEQRMSYAQLDAEMDRVAATLQRDGLKPREAIAICAYANNAYLVLFMGALRAGIAVAPLAPSSTPAQIAGMTADAGARHLFLDAANAQAVPAGLTGAQVQRIRLDESEGDTRLSSWLAPAGSRGQAVAIDPAWPFNIIYSSGTTGTPKGIVQPHSMRWSQVRRAEAGGYGPDAVTLIATPLYSNTTLVVVIPTLARGGARGAAAEVRLRVVPRAGREAPRHPHDAGAGAIPAPDGVARLSTATTCRAFSFKACTSAPFRAELKAEVLRRWPGGLTEYYGMTEGGGSTILYCHLHPNKLHTVGQPAEGHEIRLIDEDGRELPNGADVIGEVVGRSSSMMLGYHNQAAKSREAEWFDAKGRRFIRTGDVGRFDEDGFLVLMDRRKDMIISGGFNIYPSDLEAELRQHPAVADVAVVGVASEQWGETPVAFVVRRTGHGDAPDAIKHWLNERVGKTQRLADLKLLDELPRSAIGKVLKRELRDSYRA